MAIRFYKDIETQEDIQFKNASGTNAGKIEQSGDDLVISNAVGDVLFGDTNSDVYIGDGVNNVDLLFEQSGSIKGEDGGSVTLTVGSSDTTLSLYAPKITNLSTQSSEATALMINGSNVVGTRELGSAAFSNTSAFASSSHTHAASDVTSGTFAGARIPNLDASKITSGTFATARIPSLAASKITSGTFDVNRIPDLSATYIKGSTSNVSEYIHLNQNPVGTTYGDTISTTPSYYYGQKVGDNDGWRIYGEAPATNDVKMVFEIIDDIESGDTWIFRNKKTYSPYTANDVVIIEGNGDITTDGEVTMDGRLRIGTVDSNTSSTSALVLNGTEVEKRTLGSNAFNSTSFLTSVNNSNWSGTDLAIANGGTGASTASAARTNLGLGSMATANTSDYDKYEDWNLVADDDSSSAIRSDNYVKFVGASVSGSGTSGDPYEVNISTGGTGTVTSVSGTGTKNGLTLTGTVTSSGSLTLGGTLAISNADWSGTDLAIANGGTGASTASGARTNLGLGTAATSASTDFISSSGNDSINHATNQKGLGIYTSGGGQPTTHQLQIGRSGSQYWGVRTDDTTAYLVHRQDETDSTVHGTRFEIWSSSSGEASWRWAKANNSGGSQAEKMKLTDSSVLTLGGGSNTITDTKVGNWDTAYGWGDHSTQGYLTSETYSTASELLTAIKTVDGSGSGLDADTLDGISSNSFLRSNNDDTTTGTLTIGDGSNQARLLLKKADNNTSNHIEFYNGTTRVGEIGCHDNTWLRINQQTATNIYTPRYIRADNGFFVDGTSKGINGSGNFIGGTITGASDANVSNWDTAYGWGNHASAGYSTASGVEDNANNYSLPTATASVLGGVKIGSGITITSGVISADSQTDNNFTNALKTKLDGIATSANNYTHPTHPGDDFSIDTGALTGATVISDLDINVTTDTLGHVTDANAAVSTRTLTLANLGYTGATDANNYVHPTGAGNKHIPSGGSSGQFLKYSSSGTAVWATPSYTTSLAWGSITGKPTLDNYANWNLVDGGDNVNRIDSTEYVKISGGDISGTGTQSDPFVVTTPNTTYTADGNYGMTLSGTAFRLENDRRRNSSTQDIHTGNTHDYTFYDADVGIRWYTAGAEEMRLEDDGDLHVDGDVIAYSTTVSDRRLKDDIETIQDATDKVKQLRGVEYTWNDGSREGQREIGVIAQEVEKVVPEIVHEKSLPFLGNDETYKTVDYEKLVALLIESNKELASRVETLEAKLDGLTK